MKLATYPKLVMLKAMNSNQKKKIKLEEPS